MALRHYGTTALRHYGTTAIRHYGTIALRQTALWHYGTLALQHSCTTAPQHYGTTALEAFPFLFLIFGKTKHDKFGGKRFPSQLVDIAGAGGESGDLA